MPINNLKKFLIDYFIINQCTIIENEKNKITVKLTQDLDEKLMNRPFYWHYMKKLNKIGEPKELTINLGSEQNPQADGEWIHFGSPRLHQIFNHIEEQGKYVRFFEKIKSSNQTPLNPWLVLNLKINYLGENNKEEIVSLGLQLINGAIYSNFMEKIKQYSFDKNCHDYCYPITPLIKQESAVNRVYKFIHHYLKNQELEWARKSNDRLQKEMELLEYFFNEASSSNLSTIDQEKKLLKDRLEPKIKIDIINGGYFYVTNTTNKNILANA